MKLTFKHYLALLVPTLFLLAYQNCGPSFKANSAFKDGLSLGAPEGSDSPAPEEALPTRTVLQTRVYLGGSGPFVQPLVIDHSNDTVTKMPLLAVPAQAVGWINLDPLNHSKSFMWRRFLSWFPLGMTYAFMYMARYNIDALATAEVITKAEKSQVSGWGFFVYAVALFTTGPLIDRIGGKKGMILASLGAAIFNISMGWVLYLHLNGSSRCLNLLSEF